MSFENIIVEKKDAVGIIILNRPKALNALSAALTKELETALIELDGDNSIGCMVITGSELSLIHISEPTRPERI